MTATLIPDQLDEFRLQQARALERKAQAAKLVNDAMTSNGGSGMAGGVYMVGNQYGNLAKSLGGSLMGALADRDMQNAQFSQNAAQADWSDRYANATPEQQQQLLIEARNKGLKYDLESAFRKEEADRIERGEQLAADRVAKAEEAERARIEAGEQKAADRVARSDDIRLRATTPNVNVNFGGGRGKAPSGYRWNEDGTELEPIPGGPKDVSNAPAKPLSPPQEKAALELGGEYGNIRRLSDSFKDEYSGDLRSSLQREFGKAAGGFAPKDTQEMTRWWSDQAYMDELPKRHELFGAALTAVEQRSWKDAAINPSLSPKVIRERLATRQRIMEDAASRMRGSAVAGGKSGKQFDAATGGITPQQSATPVRKWNPAKGDFE